MQTYEPIVGMFRDLRVCDYCSLPDDSACWSSCQKKRCFSGAPTFHLTDLVTKYQPCTNKGELLGVHLGGVMFCSIPVTWTQRRWDVASLGPKCCSFPMCSGHAALHGHNRAARSCEGDGISAEDGPQGSGQRAVKTWPWGAKGWKRKHTIYVESLGWLGHVCSLKLKCSYLVRFVPLA